jgi:hypothetical protein
MLFCHLGKKLYVCYALGRECRPIFQVMRYALRVLEVKGGVTVYSRGSPPFSF